MREDGAPGFPGPAPGGLSVGHVTSVFKGEVMRGCSHAHTVAKSLARCGTSFVSLGNPESVFLHMEGKVKILDSR